MPNKSSVIPVITIDGPAGSGKGTLAQRLATELAWHLLDSGAIYRVAALHALQQGLPLDDEARLVAVIADLQISFQADVVLLNGIEVNSLIRNEECASATSKISALPQVRQALLARQQAFLQPPGLVADGRDMGTVVFPQAPLKFYLTASAECRAERRFKQLIAQGISANLPDLINDICQRDARDTNRAVAPLKAADDALVLDTSAFDGDQVFEIVLNHVKQRLSTV